VEDYCYRNPAATDSLGNTECDWYGVDVNVVTGDIRQYAGEYDLILSNPPWQKVGTGRLSPIDSRNLRPNRIILYYAGFVICSKEKLEARGKSIDNLSKLPR
jgi:tRNA1(Val) A37 N6-methylase TrmN6